MSIRNLGIADYEAYFMYIQNARNTLLGSVYEQYGLFFPLIDAFALKRWGLKKKETTTNLVPMKVKDDGNIDDAEKKVSQIKG